MTLAAWIAIGLLIRIALAPYSSWSNDTAVWFHTSLSGLYGLELYARPGFSYPPIWGYWLEAIGVLVRSLGWPPSVLGVYDPRFVPASITTADFSDIVTSPVYNLLYKAPLFVVDTLSAGIIYRVVHLQTYNSNRARLGLLLWFLNPFVIYESAVEGAADTIVGFAVLASVALALHGKALSAGMAWAFGIVTKLTPAVVGLMLLMSAMRAPGNSGRARRIAEFGVGAAIVLLAALLPLMLSGSFAALGLNVFHRTREPVTVGGLSLFGVRHFKELAWVLPWAYQHSALVTRISALSQAIAAFLWTAWAFVVGRRRPAFGLLTGTVGALSSVMLLAPLAQPPYILWWLPVLVVLVAAFGRGYVALALISLAGLTFSIGVLGPAAVVAPLAEYTKFLDPTAVGSSVTSWYGAPARLWGVTRPDDYFAPSAAATIASVIALYISWAAAVTRVQSGSFHSR